MLIISNFLLWIVVLLQFVAIVALGRRLKARGLTGADDRRGGVTPIWREQSSSGAPSARTRSAGSDVQDGKAGLPTMLLYMSEGCQLGKRLIPDAELMARTEGIRFVLARDGQSEAGAPLPPGRIRSSSRRRPSRNGKGGTLPAPYVMIVNDAGKVAAQGEVSSRGDLAHLLASASTQMAKAESGKAALTG